MAKQHRSIPNLTEQDIKRFWSKVEDRQFLSADQCWLWKSASKTKAGYGTFYIQGTSKLLATRISYFLHYEADPGDLLVCHECDNPSCVNPNHFFLGTYKDNNQDAKNKGRNAAGDRHRSRTRPESVKRGSEHGSARLSESQILFIRGMYANGGIHQEWIAQMFGVTRPHVSMIVNSNVWTHVKHLSNIKRFTA
jgi:hypothetical protein